jgi:hypothetical protein
MPRINGVCPVCRTRTYTNAASITAPQIEGQPALPCPGRHRANDVRRVLSLSMLPDEQNCYVGTGNFISESEVLI